MAMIKNEKFVVVGGASLLGSHIGEQLLNAGASEVVLLDNLSLGSTDNIDALLADPRCRFVRGDALRLNELFDAFEGASGVFAVAGFLASPMTSNPWLGLDVNIRGLQNILEASRYRNVSKVVFSSSVGVYGVVGDEPITEASPLHWQGMAPGVGLYCASKVMGEALGGLYRQQHGVDFVALRYSALYGERLHRRALDATRIIDAYEAVRAGRRPVINGEGNGVSDYIYIGDAARANLMAMEADTQGQSVNIVSGVDTLQEDVVRLVIRACGSDLEPEKRFDDTGLKMPVVEKLAFSRAEAERLLGWVPAVSLKEGIDRLVLWLRSEEA
jgi:UDP-glucose 4-epimerase